MHKNTWASVFLKLLGIFLIFFGLHKNQLIASLSGHLDVSYLTSFKNLDVQEIVNEPLHLANTDDASTLLVQQVYQSTSKTPLKAQPDTNENAATDKKSIYIYNTHQYEGYEGGTVMDGARYLALQLENKGYEVVVEENDFEAFKRENNMDLTETYPTSRIFLERQLASHGPFDLIIDFHRDAISKDASTLINDQGSFAKMMMVISLSASFHEEVEANSAVIRQEAEAIMPGIMRSDFKREYAYFNQQYAHSMVLIEIGGMENAYSEVQNSLQVLAAAIDNALKEDQIQ